jgi:phenylacetate-CoA ligase
MRGDFRPLYNRGARDSTHWNEYMETMPREELDALHLRRIRRNITYAYNNIELYHDLFQQAGIKPSDIKTLEDFNTKVPILDKPDFIELQKQNQANPFEGRDPAGPEHQLYRFQTSGTTGVPLQEAISFPLTIKMGECWTYGFWNCGMRPDDSFYFAFPFGTFCGFWSAYWGVRRLGGMIRSGAGLSTDERIQDIVDFNPDVLVATPTYAMHLVERANEMGIDLSETNVRFTVHAGEKGPHVPSVRKRISEGWGADVWDLYGQSESPFLGPTMNIDSGGVHPCEPYFYSVVIDPDTGEVIEEDGHRGEHVVTTHLPGAPGLTLRYRTHDLVEMYEDPNDIFETDITWKFFNGNVLDRTDNMVSIRGTNIYPRAIEELMTGVPGASSHYEIHVYRDNSNDRVEVKIEAEPSIDTAEYGDVSQQIQHEIKSAVGVTLNIDVLDPDELPRYELKARRFFDHRDEV